MRKITHAEFLAELRAQLVPVKYLAVVCPRCKTVQNMADFDQDSQLSKTDIDKTFGFNCIGRYTGKGEPKPGQFGCNWSLGGLFRLHELEVEFEGKLHANFEIATPEQAQARMNATGGRFIKQPEISVDRGARMWALFDGFECVDGFRPYVDETQALADAKTAMAEHTNAEPAIVYPVVESVRMTQVRRRKR